MRNDRKWRNEVKDEKIIKRKKKMGKRGKDCQKEEKKQMI